MIAFRALFSLISILSVMANPSPRSTLLVHESRDSVPNGFVTNGPASGGTTITLRMALTSNNLTGLEAALYDVSTPGNKLYGQHLTKAEVEAFVAPSPETKSAVAEWLSANGVQATVLSPAGDWLNFTMEVSKANELFDAAFTVFTNEATGDKTIRTLSYSIPANLKNHINLVHPTVAFPFKPTTAPMVFTAKTTTTSVPTPNAVLGFCNPFAIDPSCLQALYGLPATVGPQNASQIAVSGFNNETAQQADLSSFLQKYRPDLDPDLGFSLQTVDGGSNPQGEHIDNVEANLDIQYTVGVAGGVPVTFISVGQAFDGAGGFFDLADFLLAENEPPQVLSTSYSFNETDIPSSIARKLCNAYMQLGARGVSLLFSTGDNGVAGNVPKNNCTTFSPTFPATCPFVTAVGATEGFGPETAASLSAGGFSNIFPIPSYQANAVSTFLENLGDTYDGLFNNTGRGYPDLSAQGVNIAIFNASEMTIVDGTSASTPIVASLVAQVNAGRLAAGQNTLGFLNPLIYGNPDLFTDIIFGNNPGCNTEGFSAGTGWDPVTGLGTPLFSAFSAIP